jgi:acyl-CoA synthetase (AMP-forming)/AMP-acid ligase II
MNWNPEFNVATSFVDRNVLEGRARRTAIECGDEKVSYEQLLDRTNRAGNVLLQLGVRAEERVLLMLLDTPEFLYCFFGAIKIGAVAVPVNTLLKPDEYEYLFNTARARVAVVSESLLPLLESIGRERLRFLQEIRIFCVSPTRWMLHPTNLKRNRPAKMPPPFGSILPEAPELPKLACTFIATWSCVPSCMLKASCT